jgi:molybdate transport system substrate-binding protein
MLGWREGIVGVLVLVACGRPGGELRVYGAASLREVLHREAEVFDPTIVVSTGGSNLVADQLLAGARGDVIVAASATDVERLVEAGLVDALDVRHLFRNRLVVIVPVLSMAQAADLFGMTRGRLALAHPQAVPAGRYARAWLQSCDVWTALEPFVLPGLDVRAALAAVESGAADFGIVYATDAATSSGVRVVQVVEDGPQVEYVGAALLASKQLDRARAFVAALDAIGPDRAATADTHARLLSAGFGVDE